MTVSGESPIRMGAPALRISLEGNSSAPSLARAAITGFSEGSAIESARLATLKLLVSEIVTNAVIHSGAATGEIVLSARLLDNGDVRVEVTDGGEGFTPVPRDLARPDGGYGLYLVEKEARSWGVDHSGGTRVWFELAVHQAA